MTLEEKVSQTIFDAPAIERLGIPRYNWWNECLHGLGRAGLATVFPQAIGLAAAWNPDLVHQVATVTSDEARAKHHEAARRGIREIYTGLTFWTPNINIFRDPRWGRGQETYGEDPYLTSRIGVAFVKGLQGDDPRYLKLVATPKHYAVHSGPEPDRHHFDAQVSERDLWETYLPAFEACVRDADAGSVMGAYNRVHGEPCCASRRLLQRILRDKWGFEGYVVSDCGAIRDIFAHHDVVPTPEEAAARAVEMGCDLNCGATYHALLIALDKELISEETIDQAVKRLFTARFRLGMFDPPERMPYAQIPYRVIDSPEHRALALRAARESIVLLKNEDDLLPLRKDLDSVAIIGPNADNLQALLGNYNGTPARAVTPLEGVRRKISSATTLYYAQGCAIADGVPSLQVIPSTYLRPADVGVNEDGLTAAYYDTPEFEGQPALSQTDPVVDFTWKDTTPLAGQWGDSFAARWTGFLVPPVSGTYTLGVSGFSEYHLRLDDASIADYRGIHHSVRRSKEVELEAGRFYRLQLDYVNRGLDPQVQLLWSLPDIDYQAKALEAAEDAEVVIAVMGLSPAVEGEEMPVDVEGFLGGDRTDIALPRPQQQLIERVSALGKPVVLVLLGGSAVAFRDIAARVPAIVSAWYPGQAGGEALADVLFGDYNPGGRLPVTFYKSVDDLPPFDDYAMDGRTYRYFRGEPLFPFGHGLSYTTFAFDDLRLDSRQVSAGGRVEVSVDVRNTGGRAGAEVVQLYVRHRDVPAPRPIKELGGFKRISLQPGERKTVTFTLHTDQLGHYDDPMGYVIQPGTVEVMVGSSSENLPLTGTFEIIGQTTSVGDSRVFFSEVQLE
jgi:beta-glucosidase